ncbi:MAG: UDP-N-acetylmuramate--L-alanine ligase [Peptococcaceae bacterium]|nr:UDP-N-acetylmuramate--L-alanine ligase [Peptococcaceae bacterium]
MPKHVHFVGVKGTGMSALAQISAQLEGAIVTGSDVPERFFTDQVLENAHIPVFDFSADNVRGKDLVVVSAAYTTTHPEVQRAAELHIPILSYPQYLGRLMSRKRGISVSGTHGKTTTTAMLGFTMIEAGQDPLIIVGSDVPCIGGNTHYGNGHFFLAESCEYRRHFLNYSPEYLVITNLDFDHPDYFTDIHDVIDAFQAFARKIPAHGRVFIWAEDEHRLAIQSAAPIVTFGLSADADVRATALDFHDEGSSMQVFIRGEFAGDLILHVPGKHNVLNALATIAVCREIGIPIPVVLAILSRFSGSKRRFERLGTYRGALIVDDYAHHPTEIRTTLEGARLAYPDRRIRAVFQPHTFSRTQNLLHEFACCFPAADEVLVADVFASARERDLPAVPMTELADLIREQGVPVRYLGNLTTIKKYLAETANAQDLILTLGAGNIYQAGQYLVNLDEQ